MANRDLLGCKLAIVGVGVGALRITIAFKGENGKIYLEPVEGMDYEIEEAELNRLRKDFETYISGFSGAAKGGVYQCQLGTNQTRMLFLKFDDIVFIK